MAIKKYTNGSWVPASYRKYGTETDTITMFPATVIGDGTPISSYVIKGNMEQNGTPTPSSPIYPSECGERTENLVESVEQGTWSTAEFVKVDTNIRCRIGNIIDVIAEQSYTIHCETTGSTPGLVNIQYMNDSGTSIGESGWKSFVTSGNYTATIPSGATKITIILALSPGNKNCSPLDFSNVMLTAGSTAPTSYIPYGYKLPITLGGTTTNIYLGEVQTTRRIKKLVLTGDENVTAHSIIESWFQMFLSDIVINDLELCTHYTPSSNIDPAKIQNGEIMVRKQQLYDEGRIIIKDTTYTTAEDFKSYLAAQYAAGTPVTIWYVLAEPETGIVNEPIRKIGDYMDSVSGTNLATSGTAQQFDVGTALKPSEIDLTYHGWHEHGDTKFTT